MICLYVDFYANRVSPVAKCVYWLSPCRAGTHWQMGGQRGFYFSWRICIVSAAARSSCLLSSDLLQPPTLLTLNKLISRVRSWTLEVMARLKPQLHILSCTSLCLAYILNKTCTQVLTNGLISTPKDLWLFFSCSIRPHVVTLQPAEVFEFDGNVYSHHLSPIARKHSLIAGVWPQWGR